MKNYVQNYIAETIQELIRLNQLEDESKSCRKRKDQRIDHQTLMESLRGTLLPSVLVQHDRMRARGKRSIAPVHHGVCAGCHMALAVGNLNILKRGEDLRKCGNCGRFIYLDEGNDGAEDALVPARKWSAAKTNLNPVTVNS